MIFEGLCRAALASTVESLKANLPPRQQDLRDVHVEPSLPKAVADGFVHVIASHSFPGAVPDGLVDMLAFLHFVLWLA